MPQPLSTPQGRRLGHRIRTLRFDIAERLNVELYDLLLDPDTSDRARAGEALRLASPEAQSQVYALVDPWMPPRSTTVGT